MAKRDPLYQQIAQLVGARARCAADDHRHEWFRKHEERIHALVKEHLPSGSGFDNGTKIDLDASTEEKLVFETAFHHMDEHGSYDGWTEHKVTVRASLAFGFRLTISGRDRNQIKDYMHECFEHALSAVPERRKAHA